MAGETSAGAFWAVAGGQNWGRWPIILARYAGALAEERTAIVNAACRLCGIGLSKNKRLDGEYEHSGFGDQFPRLFLGHLRKTMRLENYGGSIDILEHRKLVLPFNRPHDNQSVPYPNAPLIVVLTSRQMAVTRDEFEASMRRYGNIVAWSAVGAFGLFDAILWAIIYLFGPEIKQLRAWAFAFGPLGEALFAFSIILAALVVPVALLVVIVRRANQDPNVRCPACAKHFSDKRIVRQLMTIGRCPRCQLQLFPEIEHTPAEKKASTLNFSILVAFLCGFGVMFLVTAFTKLSLERYVYLAVAVLNFAVAGYAVFRRVRRHSSDAAGGQGESSAF